MVSPRKSISTVNLTAEELSTNKSNGNKLTPSTRKSCESLYSAYSAASSRGSATMLCRKKIPPNFGMRPPGIIPATTEVRQRVISARRLRFKNIQNQLGLAQHTITELSNELRVLRTLHKRQNSALAKYESTNAELPRLLNAHAEELRVWQTKHRTLQAAHKELVQKLKQKESLILTLGDENKYYSQLNKDKNLDDRQRLAEKLQSLEIRLQEKENQMKIAERRAHLEIKNLKQQLMVEQKKTKDVVQKLEKARIELSSYRKLEELNITDKLSSMTLKQQTNSKLEMRTSSKKSHHDSSRTNASKTPSPVNNADDDDFPVSHRSQKSTTSSINIDFATTRSMRKTASLRKRYGHDSFGSTSAEVVGDGPDSKKRLEPLDRQMKMMVNIPSFDGAEGDTASLNEDDGDVIFSSGTKVDASLHNGVIYSYSQDFVGSFDEDENNNEDENDDENEIDEESGLDCDAKFKNKENTKLDNDDYVNNDESKTTLCNANGDISNIRKKITDDFKQREAFLDTFCRQANATGTATTTTTAAAGQRNVVNDGTKKNADNNTSNQPPAASRKHKLLAVLKAIDDDERSNQD